MAICKPISGASLELHCVDVGDAAKILELRNHPKLSKYLPPIPISLEDQIRWIERQRNNSSEYYFAIRKKSQALKNTEGFIGIYNISLDKPRAAEWGRWILEPGSMASVESAYLLYEFCFEILNLDLIYCISILDNENVVRFHDGCGLSRVKILPKHISIAGIDYDAVQHELTVSQWEKVKLKLGPMVARYAHLNSR
jgi:RimJ/RimL family protein N-acetyltransferase